MRSAFEHSQRENLCVPLVLVCHLERFEWNIFGLPTSRHHGTQIEIVPVESSLPSRPLQTSQSRLRRMPNRRLVRAVPARKEHRSVDIQGINICPRRQPHRESARRLTLSIERTSSTPTTLSYSSLVFLYRTVNMSSSTSKYSILLNLLLTLRKFIVFM